MALDGEKEEIKQLVELFRRKNIDCYDNNMFGGEFYYLNSGNKRDDL